MHRMLHKRSELYSGSNVGWRFSRCMSNAEIATALRPFYFIVHPDLFGRYPEQRTVNEESLKHLSAHLEAIQHRRQLTSPKVLSFYIRISQKSNTEKLHKFKLINIQIQRNPAAKDVVKKILETCSLSTEYVDKIKSPAATSAGPLKSPIFNRRQRETTNNTTTNDEYYGMHSAFGGEEHAYEKIRKSQQKTLKLWIGANLSMAHERAIALNGLREEVRKLERLICGQLKLNAIHYDCGWNIEHYRGCLKSLERMAEMHEMDMKPLHGRTIVFALCSGVSLEGHIMLFTGDVQRNWLDFIQNIRKQDEYLQRIPSYEMALSQVLRGIRIARRKFMPKAQVVHYADQLRKVTTSMLDYLTMHKYPNVWPNSLNEFELVIESEAGPLMVSPTGQFIAPSTCPGSILVDFLTTHIDEAKQKSNEYKKNKYVEKELHERCVKEMKLKSLSKDDSIDPNKMIDCLIKLLASHLTLSNTVLHITHYYSVLSDGTVCIPWNWILE